MPQQAQNNRSALAILWLTLFMDLIGFSMIFPLMPEMLNFYLLGGHENQGWLQHFVNWAVKISPLDSGSGKFFTTVLFGGILSALYSLLQFLFAPIWGSLSDRFGRRPILLLTLIGTMIGHIVWFFAGSFFLLLLSRLLTGIMSGNLSVATAAIADLTTKENRTRGMALVGIAFGMGFILGPAIGGLSSTVNLLNYVPDGARWGITPFSVPAFVATILAAINVIFAYTCLRETLQTKDWQENDAIQTPLTRVKSLFQVSVPAIRYVNWVYFMFILSFSSVEFSLTFTTMARFSYTARDSGYMFVYIGLAVVLTQSVLVRRLAPKWGERLLAFHGLCYGTLSLAILAKASTQPIFYLGLAVLAIGVGFLNSSLAGLVSLYSPGDQQGSNLGVFRSAGALARAIGPFLGGLGYFCLSAKVSYLISAVVLALPLIILTRVPAVANSAE